MDYQLLLEKTREHVLSYYNTHGNSKLIYHNAEHTEGVVAAVSQIASNYELSSKDHFVVMAAAWFHDLGYLVDTTNHEEKGIELATEYFKENKVSDKQLELINGCITATKMPQSPHTLLEEIICDADLFHLGTSDFAENDKKIHEEYNLLHNTDVDKFAWREKTLKFLEAHTYFTDYCKNLLNDTQEENIGQLKKKIAKAEKKGKHHKQQEDKLNAEPVLVLNDEPVAEITEKEKKKKHKEHEDEKPDKGIETMFRISSSNHQRLSDMADRKAHIMITVNSIILSAIISLVLRRLSEYGYLIIPSFILLTISLLAMTFSILSTRPSIPKGIFTKDDVDQKRVNLLFFGNFYKMPLEDFTYGMEKMMLDRDFLYGSLIKDVYSQGIVLGKKYHLLRIAYNIFMFGLIVAIVAFIIAVAFFGH
jgi:predicted metal-dependent HD superfamily phosphohydrolase